MPRTALNILRELKNEYVIYLQTVRIFNSEKDTASLDRLLYLSYKIKKLFFSIKSDVDFLYYHYCFPDLIDSSCILEIEKICKNASDIFLKNKKKYDEVLENLADKAKD